MTIHPLSTTEDEMDAKTRYVAEWITAQSSEDPTDCDYGTSEHGTHKRAEIAAQAAAAKGPCDWWRVAEEVFDPDCYGRGARGWKTERMWVEGILV